MLNKKQLKLSQEKSSIREKNKQKFILKDENEYGEYLYDVGVKNFLESIFSIVDKIILANQLKGEEKEEVKDNIIYSNLNQYFEIFFNGYKESRNKENFLEEYLGKIEELVYYFIDDKKDENGKIIEYGDKKLYGYLAELYKGIGDYKKALEAYTDGIESFVGNNYMYGKIGELYNENKIDGVDKTRSKQLAIKNFDTFYDVAKEKSDIGYEILALELLGDALSGIDNKEAIEKYSLALELINEYNLSDQLDISIIIKKIIENTDNSIYISEFLGQLSMLGKENLIYIGEYYEKKGKLEYAFFNYLEAFQYKIDGAKEKMLDFLENSLINGKLKKTLKENIEKKNQQNSYKNIKKINLDIEETEIKIKEVKIAIRNIKKFGFLRQDKVNIFLNSLNYDFFDLLKYESIVPYINKYNIEIYYNENKEVINNNSIFLSEIIDFLYGQKFYDEKFKNNLKEIYKKVCREEELKEKDLKIIFEALDIKNDPNYNLEYIRKKIYSGEKITKSEEDFLMKYSDSNKLYDFGENTNYSDEAERLLMESFLKWNK